MKIDVNGVSIILTPEQLKQIDAQRNKSINDINSYLDACEILSESSNTKASPLEQLLTIIKAANYLDNGNIIWKQDWKNKEYGYIPYFEFSGSGWVAFGVDFHFYYSDAPGGLYYKKESTAELFQKRFINLYNQVLIG